MLVKAAVASHPKMTMSASFSHFALTSFTSSNTTMPATITAPVTAARPNPAATPIVREYKKSSSMSKGNEYYDSSLKI